jgi:hypothetical protein
MVWFEILPALNIGPARKSLPFSKRVVHTLNFVTYVVMEYLCVFSIVDLVTLEKLLLTNQSTDPDPNSTNMESIDDQFTRALSAAAQLYEDGKFEECVKALKILLDDPAIPRYHRIKCLTLLGGTLDDWTGLLSI